MLCSAAEYDWCTVPDSGYDVIVFAGIAVLVACCFRGKFSNLMILIAGMHEAVANAVKTLQAGVTLSCAHRRSSARLHVPIQPRQAGQRHHLVAWHIALRAFLLHLPATPAL